MKRVLPAAALAAGLAAALAIPVVQARPGARTVDNATVVEAEPGDGWLAIATKCGVTLTDFHRITGIKSTETLHARRRVLCPGPATVVVTTTTTVAPTTTTVAPTTTVTPTTTTLPPTTTVPPTEPPGGETFLEEFTGDTTLTGFRTGVFHRDVDTQGTTLGADTWSADHADHGNGDCGQPNTSRTIHEQPRDEAIFLCQSVDGDPAKAHLMTAMGHTDSYSIVWFSPVRTFSEADTVSWDVNVTDMGGRQWWEVMITPVGTPDATCISWLPCDLPSYDPAAVVVSTRDLKTRIVADGTEVDPTWQPICRTDWALDPEGCASKAIRRTWTVVDNGNGTITVRFLDNTWTVPGEFPAGEWKVVIKDHNYTPLKDGPVSGFTWHWDNLSIS